MVAKKKILPLPSDWVCDICGKEARVHLCIDRGHEYYCNKCFEEKGIFKRVC